MREYALTMAVTAAVTYLLTPFAKRLAIRIGAVAQVRDRDVHSVPIPRMGGVAMYLGVLGGLLVASRLPALQATFTTSGEPQAVALAATILVIVGILDDRYTLDALTKLAGQTLAAGVMVLRGVQLLYLPTGQAHSYLVLGPDIGVPVTIVLVVLTINAVNFIDGLDGLAAGVVGIAALSLLLYSYQLSVVHGIDRATPPALLASVVAGACVGFLPHNFNPATVFMGDSGSMLIGLLLSAATVGITGQVDPLAVGQLDLFPVLLPVLLPLAVLAVPFVDLTLAVLRRTRAGRAPWAPDKQHLHHRLLELGHSHARAVLIMYAWTALVAFTAVSLGLTHNIALVASLALGVGVLVLVAMSVPRLRHLRHGS